MTQIQYKSGNSTVLTKPDGSIEYANSPCHCPPTADTSTGMHVSHGSTWYRVNDGEWKRVRQRVVDVYELAHAAETVEEFQKAMRDDA